MQISCSFSYVSYMYLYIEKNKTGLSVRGQLGLYRIAGIFRGWWGGGGKISWFSW